MSDDTTKLGPTGEFPDGKLNEHDEGELKMGITHSAGNVVVNFGHPVKWFALPSRQAREFANLILMNADKADKNNVPQ